MSLAMSCFFLRFSCTTGFVDSGCGFLGALPCSKDLGWDTALSLWLLAKATCRATVTLLLSLVLWCLVARTSNSQCLLVGPRTLVVEMSVLRHYTHSMHTCVVNRFRVAEVSVPLLVVRSWVVDLHCRCLSTKATCRATLICLLLTLVSHTHTLDSGCPSSRCCCL